MCLFDHFSIVLIFGLLLFDTFLQPIGTPLKLDGHSSKLSNQVLRHLEGLQSKGLGPQRTD